MLDNVKNWFADPFNADMDAKDWFLFIGLIILSVILWRILLSHILEGIS